MTRTNAREVQVSQLAVQTSENDVVAAFSAKLAKLGHVRDSEVLQTDPRS